MSGPCGVDTDAKQSHVVQGNEEKIAGVRPDETDQGKSAIVIFSRRLWSNFYQHTKSGGHFYPSSWDNCSSP